ncbi:MAG TPA: hypothetical protein DDZ51_16360 [Planctomycetaceae bacterium]|nr:hypothetical protein [Planctomycetaceae bacterium]
MPNPEDLTTPDLNVVRKAIRNVGRLFDSVGEAMWIVDSGHALIYINAEACQWLGHDTTALAGRLCHAANDRSNPLGDSLAAIAPPLGLSSATSMVVRVAPAGRNSRLVRFTMHGNGDSAFIMAITGAMLNIRLDDEVEASETLRQRLESWRRQHATSGLIVSAGSSLHAIRIRNQIQLAASTRQSFAIVGPRGSGGESIARRIHLLGVRGGDAADPIISVETPLMDAELLEATLSPAAAYLGRGTGSTVTLILRGLDESPHEVQDRIVDFGAGASGSVRLIGLLNASPQFGAGGSATPLSTKMALAMSVLELGLPAIADRAEDIPLIATALVENRHAAGKCMAERLSRVAIDRLLLYPWPENFEELDSAIRHACSVCRTSAIGPDDLPLSIRSFRSHGVSKPKPIVATNLDDAMRDFELRKIHQALQSADGNRSEAARLLGISRARLLRRLDGSIDQENDE